MKFKIVIEVLKDMKFPSDEEYLEFVKSLDSYKLRLTCGNCGMFAYALKETFNVGKLAKVGYFAHVLLKFRNKYYDGVRIYTYKELKNSCWGEYFGEGYEEIKELGDDIYNDIKINTCNTKDKEFFKEIIVEKLCNKL